MVKLLFLPLLSLAFALSPKQANESVNYRDYLNTSLNERGNYTLDSINSFSGNEFRIYHYDDLLIDEISDNAFSGTSFSSLVLTNSVTHINQAAFENASNIKTVSFTGSKEEFDSLGISFSKITYYAVDEGFINYWNKNIRPESTSNICSISQDTFNHVNDLYKNLSDEDLKAVNNYVDLANVKISESMKELIRVFATPEPAKKNDEWNQTGAIILIIFIAVIGMTSITIFYLLKTKNIIH